MTELPIHKFVVPLLFNVTVGMGVTEIVCEAVLDPQLFVAVTIYVPAADTDILAVVAPVFQEYEIPPLAVREMESPAQIVELPLAAIDVEGGETLFMVMELFELPQELLAVTE